MKGKESQPITSWSRMDRVSRSVNGLWGASKYAHRPDIFIANILRPVASAMAEGYPLKSDRRKELYDYADTNFTVDDQKMHDIRKSLRSIRTARLNTELLEKLSKKPDTAEGFSASSILTLQEGASTYVEPNTALMSDKPKVELRGDRVIIENQIKYLAQLALGDVAVISPRQTQANRGQDAA